MDPYLQLFEEIEEFLENYCDYPENQANVPAEPEPQPCVPVADPMQGNPQDAAQSLELTSERPNVIGAVVTQSSVTHAGETLLVPHGEPRTTAAESQQAGLLSQTKATAGSQAKDGDDPSKSLLTRCQEATYQESWLGVSSEGSQKETFSDKKILDVGHSAALCGGQEETFSGNQTPPCGSHVVTFASVQTSSEDHPVTSLSDHTVWRQVKTFNGDPISCGTQISLIDDSTHSGAQRRPSDKTFGGSQMSRSDNPNLCMGHVYPSFDSYFYGTQMSPSGSQSLHASYTHGTQMDPQGSPYVYGTQMYPSVTSTTSAAQTGAIGNQTLYGAPMGATGNPILYTGQNISRDQIGMKNGGQIHNMGLVVSNLTYQISDGSHRMNSEVLCASSAPFTQGQHPEYIASCPLMQGQPSENMWRMQKASDLSKPYICPYPDCGKAYSRGVHLRIHIRVHTGERPYVCDVQGCTWKFSRSDELLRHKRRHNGERPYQCTSCNKNFARSDHLRQHQRTHRNHSPHIGTLSSSANVYN